MRISNPSRPIGRIDRRSMRVSGFTLTEIMVAMAIMMIVVAGTFYTHFFGIRLYELSKAKLGASDEARRALNLMVADIRSAKIVRIGNGDLTSFNQIADGTAHAGSAIQIHPTTNTSAFIRYFWDSSDNRLKRTTNGATSVAVVANFITNSVVFRAEDAYGQVLSNNLNNRVISMLLEFYQLQYPIVRIGPGYHYEYYRLSSKITRRTLE